MNLFLTGDIQVGKSTAIRRFLEQTQLSVCGFRTLLDRTDFHLDMEILTPEKTTMLKIAERGEFFPLADISAFNRGGELLMEMDLSGCDLLLMDELGFLERDALGFRRAVETLLQSGIPTVGVLRNKKEGPFWDFVHALDDTEVRIVTEENRNAMPEQLQAYFSSLLKK